MRRVELADIDTLSAGLKASQIHVYFFDSDASAFDNTLSEAEQGRCLRFATPLLRNRFRACHAGKRAILARYLRRPPSAIEFLTGRFDKPRVADGAIAFNISHSANWVAIAVATGEVGVDCERIDSAIDYRRLLPTVSHPRECIGDRQAFYRTWTRKEAVMKQLGLGFQLSPVRLQVPDSDAPLHAWEGARIDHGAADLRVPLLVDVAAPPGYCAALASETAGAVRVFKLSADRPPQEARP